MRVRFLHEVPNKMKVIFLDIDGVLNSTRSYLGGKARHRKTDEDIVDHVKHDIDPVAIDLINFLRRYTDAEIVVSSSHRLDFQWDGNTRGLDSYMRTLGIDPILDATAYLPNCMRGEEIELWLREHPGVTRYVIIDDSGDMLPSQMDSFVQTDPSVGFTDKDFYKATRILGYEHEEDSGYDYSGFRFNVSPC